VATGSARASAAVKAGRRLRWWIIGLIMAGTVLNYLTRSSLSVAAPTLTKELSLSTQQYSYIVAAFQACYTVMQPIAGFILDSVGIKIGFALFAIAWSLSNCLHGLATGWMSLAFFRGLLGLSEAAIFPAAIKTVSEWFPAKERTVAIGWVNTGTSLGAMIAPPLVVWCILTYSWQAAFIITGALGIVWAIAWLLLYQSPDKHPKLGAAEREYILAGQEAPLKDAKRPSFREVVKTRRFWGIAIPRFLAEPAWQTFNFWIPLYMATVHHMNLKSIAAFAWLPFLAGDLGCVLGGYLSPFFMRRFGSSIVRSRKMVVVTGCVLMVGPACIGLVSSPYTAIALFCVGAFAHQTLLGALYALASDVFNRNEVATATGLTGMCGWLGGMIFSLIVGALASIIGYSPLFVCLSAFDLIGAVVVWNLLRDTDNMRDKDAPAGKRGTGAPLARQARPPDCGSRARTGAAAYGEIRGRGDSGQTRCPNRASRRPHCPTIGGTKIR
jgi:ACS family hexuronate transporter-like MFS transporter